MKTLQLFMSDVNVDNLNIVLTGGVMPSSQMIKTNHNFYIMTQEKIDQPFENLHQLTGGNLPTSIGFDILVAQDFTQQSLQVQEGIYRRLQIPTIRLYRDSPPESTNPQNEELYKKFSGDINVFFDILNYQRWIVNPAAKTEIMTDETSSKWNEIFQLAHKG
jgi:hypothetical protein